MDHDWKFERTFAERKQRTVRTHSCAFWGLIMILYVWQQKKSMALSLSVLSICLTYLNALCHWRLWRGSIQILCIPLRLPGKMKERWKNVLIMRATRGTYGLTLSSRLGKLPVCCCFALGWPAERRILATRKVSRSFVEIHINYKQVSLSS
jgi:hypothetical protein